MAPKKAVRKSKNDSNSKKKRRKASNDSSDDEFESHFGAKSAVIEDNNDDVNDNNDVNHDVDCDNAVLPTLSPIAGRLVLCGGTNWDLIGRKELPKAFKNQTNASTGKNLWSPHRTELRVREIISSCTACHSIIITEEGKVMTFGRNDRGQLGHSDMNRRDVPTLVEALNDYKIVSGSVGRSHTLFLTDKGIVFSCGDNKMGQLGIGSQSQSITTPTRVSYSGKPIIRTACGAEFSMILNSAGNLLSFGSPEYGQLGHNTEGKYFASGNKLAYRCELTPRRILFYIEKTREGHIIPLEDVLIEDVSCGINHTLAIDKKRRCFSWGFGGYGRLGHTETKDELMPRNIKTFDTLNRGVKSIACGGTYSLAIDVNGLLYFWGQNKSSGEATMYPKNVQDLNGWNIRSMGCANKSIVIAADNSVISWGPSPTYGELGYGEHKAKSSTTPQEMKPMEGIFAHKVSCGYAHTLIVAKEDTDEEEQLINKLPHWP